MNSEFEKRYKEMIAEKLDMLCSINGRMMFLREAKNFYIDQLMIYCDKRAKCVVLAFDDFARTATVPPIEALMAKIKVILEKEYPTKALELKPQEDAIMKSMESAIMSKMWLYYRKKMNVFAGIMDGIFPDDGLSISELISKYPEDKVNKWMEMQPQ